MPIPEAPYIVWGIISEAGTPKVSETVSIENVTAGGSDTRVTDTDGFYLYDDLAQLPNGYGQGDTIKISVAEAFKTFAALSEPEEKEININYINETLSLPASGTISKSGTFITDLSLGLSAGASQGQIGGSDFYNNVALDASSVISHAAKMDFNPVLSLPASGTISRAGILSIESLLNLAVAASQVQVGGSDFYNEIALVSNSIIQEAISVGMNPSTSLQASGALTPGSTAILEGMASLVASGAISHVGVITIDTALSLLAQASQAQTGGMSYSDNVSLASNAVISEICFVAYNPTVSLQVSGALAAVNVADFAAILALNAQGQVVFAASSEVIRFFLDILAKKGANISLVAQRG